jgi:predicted phosphodiesterase
MSDLHTDSRSTRFENPINMEMFDTDADVIIVAGDTSNDPKRTFAFLTMLANTNPFKEIVAIFRKSRVLWL